MKLTPGLYIISTPIGNLGDITIRALETLKNSNIILCEDTRVSQKLLAKFGIKAKLQVYNDHSSEKQRAMIGSLIERGEVVSLISDAGTPLISDPGYKLVRELKSKGYYVDALPGACSLITALTLSGLASDRFLFAGFLPKTAPGKQKVFTELSSLKATLIFFEAASRLLQSLQVAYEVFGNREVCVCRELTKLYQETKFGNLESLLKFYQEHTIKGEVVLLISGESAKMDQLLLDENLAASLKLHLAKGLSAKSATELAYHDYNEHFSKSEIYAKANKIKGVL